jgi:hypothetical protein
MDEDQQSIDTESMDNGDTWLSGEDDAQDGIVANGAETVGIEDSDEQGSLFGDGENDLLGDFGKSLSGGSAVGKELASIEKQAESYAKKAAEAEAKLEAAAKNLKASVQSGGIKDLEAILNNVEEALKLVTAGAVALPPPADAIVAAAGGTLLALEKTLHSWFDQYLLKPIGDYVTPDMVVVLGKAVKDDFKGLLKALIVSCFAKFKRDGNEVFETAYAAFYIKLNKSERQQQSAKDTYEIVKWVWTHLISANIPQGVAAGPCLQLEYIFIGSSYSSNPSFRNRMGDYIGGYTHAQSDAAKLVDLWQKAKVKYLASKPASGGAMVSGPTNPADYAAAVAVTQKALNYGKLWDAWAANQKDGDPLPFPAPKPLNNHDVAVLASLVRKGYRLTPTQTLRVEVTKNGEYLLGSTVLALGGLPPKTLIDQSATKGIQPKQKLPVVGKGGKLKFTKPNPPAPTGGDKTTAIVAGAAAVGAVVWLA